MEKLNSILLNEFCNLKAENERLAKLNETMLEDAITKGFGTTTTSFSDKDPDPQEQIPKTKDTDSDYSFTRLW